MRYLTAEILRMLREEKKMIFIAGPRQVGKTTLVKHLLAESGAHENYFNWDIESHRKSILKNPEGFWRAYLSLPELDNAGHSSKKIRIALDEIHKYPRWKRFLKGLFDAEGERLEILVTGSGRLDIYQRGGDSLFGRYTLFRLHPFTVGELLHPRQETVRAPRDFWKELFVEQEDLQAEKALKELEQLTGFPEPLFSSSEQRLVRWRRAHRDLVIREDLRDLTRIRDIGLIDALVNLLPERIGSPLSLNALREDLGVAFGTVQGWIETLSRLYYLFEIRPYAGRLNRTLRRESKVYLFDFSEIEEPGARFENLVALHLRKLCDVWNDWGFGNFDLYYVRDKEKREVDFLVTQNKRPYFLLETKLSDSDLSPSLRYFSERLKPAYAIVLTRRSSGKRKRVSGQNILSLPAARLLSLI